LDQLVEYQEVGGPTSNIDPTLDQTTNMELIHQILRNPHNMIISQVEIVVVGEILELNMGDNFTIHQNTLAETPFSPMPGEFCLFGNMVDEEERNGEP
jgi:hypothetical protein